MGYLYSHMYSNIMKGVAFHMLLVCCLKSERAQARSPIPGLGRRQMSAVRPSRCGEWWKCVWMGRCMGLNLNTYMLFNTHWQTGEDLINNDVEVEHSFATFSGSCAPGIMQLQTHNYTPPNFSCSYPSTYTLSPGLQLEGGSRGSTLLSLQHRHNHSSKWLIAENKLVFLLHHLQHGKSGMH